MISTFDWAGFLIFGLVFVSRDFKVGRNVSSEESTGQSHTGLIYALFQSLNILNSLFVKCCSSNFYVHIAVKSVIQLPVVRYT